MVLPEQEGEDAVTALLIRPPRKGGISFLNAMECEPLELEYLSAACRERGVAAQIWDGVTEKFPLRTVLERLCPDWVLVTGYLTQEEEMRACLRLAKEVCPSCRTMVGGAHAQRNHQRLYWPETDHVFRSESVRLELDFMLGAPEEQVPGLCWRRDGEWRETPYVPGDIRDLPLPDRSGWEVDSRHFHYFELERLSTMRTAFSCPFSCTFCYGSGLHGGIYQARAVESVLEELEQIPGENVFITDYDFLLDEARVTAILDGMEARGIRKTFICYARADFITRHPELMERLAANGFRWYAVGIESVSDQRLERWSKGTNVDENVRCVELLKELRCTCLALTIAAPDFGKKDFRALYRWAKRYGLRYTSVQILTPIPGTGFYREKREELERETMREFDLAHLVLPAQKMSHRTYMRRYGWLLIRLSVLGWLRGGYRFITPAYLWRRLRRRREERELLK